MDRLSNCSVPLVRSTRTATATSLAKTQRSSCFCWTLIRPIDYRSAFIYSVNYWLQFILAYTGVVYLIVFRIFNSPRERLRSIVMSTSVCPQDISGTTRVIFTNFLYMLPVSVARSSSGMLTIGRIAYQREGGDGSAQRGRSVIYDCLVITSTLNCYIITILLEVFGVC